MHSLFVEPEMEEFKLASQTGTVPAWHKAGKQKDIIIKIVIR